jgi:release factor glutamine methyltransferase
MPEVATRSNALLEMGARRLAEAGIAEPRRQAFRIWAGLNPSVSPGAREIELGATEVASYQDAIERLALGQPLAHVTGTCGFRHLTLRSDRRALIPRPETEGLVDLLLQRVHSGRVLDIGTGSGCIALSLAQEGGFSDVVGVDRSEEALSLAAENRALTSQAVDFVLGDLCAPIGKETADALISNPPYLTALEYAHLHPSVRDWEPALALESGQDGLGATARLLDEGRRVLRPAGWLALEVDCTRAAVAAQLATELGWQEVGIHMDLFGRERYLLARRSNTR